MILTFPVVPVDTEYYLFLIYCFVTHYTVLVSSSRSTYHVPRSEVTANTVCSFSEPRLPVVFPCLFHLITVIHGSLERFLRPPMPQLLE